MRRPISDSLRETDLADRIDDASNGGAPLDHSARGHLESTLGADFSAVRVHRGGLGDSLAGDVEATAFTTGLDIFFRDGAYAPATTAGLKLLAHEAMHTVQQSAGPVAGTPSASGVAVSDPNDAF